MLLATQVIGHPFLSSLPQRGKKKDLSRPQPILKAIFISFRGSIYLRLSPHPTPNKKKCRWVQPFSPPFHEMYSHHDVDGVCGRSASCWVGLCHLVVSQGSCCRITYLSHSRPTEAATQPPPHHHLLTCTLPVFLTFIALTSTHDLTAHCWWFRLNCEQCVKFPNINCNLRGRGWGWRFCACYWHSNKIKKQCSFLLTKAKSKPQLGTKSLLPLYLHWKTAK